MKGYKRYLLSIVMGCAILISPLLVSAPVLAASGTQPLKTTSGSLSAGQPTNTIGQPDTEADGYEMSMVPTIIDSIELHFQRAKEDMLNQDRDSASAELGRAAAFLNLQAGQADGKTNEALSLYARELNTVASDVETGIITSVDDLTHIFANAQNELAADYQQRALYAWDTADLDASMAGQDLWASVVNLEQGARWVNHTPKQDVVEQARGVADDLLAGVWSPKSIVTPLIGLDAEIERLNSSIKSVLSEEDLLLEDEMPSFNFIHPQIKPRQAEMTLQDLNVLSEFESGYIYPLADEADLYFQIAYDHIVNNDWKSAAAAIRAGATFLKLQEGRTVPGNELLHQMVIELYSVAQYVEQGQISSLDDLAITFARTDYALARHHQLKAAESWGEAEAQVRLAGQNLSGALSYFDHSNGWSGSSDESPALTDARTLATELRSNAGFETEKTDNIINALARDIEMHKLALFYENTLE